MLTINERTYAILDEVSNAYPLARKVALFDPFQREPYWGVTVPIGEAYRWLTQGDEWTEFTDTPSPRSSAILRCV